MKTIDFHPWRNNVLDYVGQPLISVEGNRVMVAQAMTSGFMIYIDGKLIESGLSNMAASSILNRIECRRE